jgi:hypothetical protein
VIKIIIKDAKIFFTVIRVDLRILDKSKNQKYQKYQKLHKIMTFDFVQHLKHSIYKSFFEQSKSNILT